MFWPICGVVTGGQERPGADTRYRIMAFHEASRTRVRSPLPPTTATALTAEPRSPRGLVVEAIRAPGEITGAESASGLLSPTGLSETLACSQPSVDTPAGGDKLRGGPVNEHGFQCHQGTSPQ
jgi:hypothetical protein